MMRMYRQSESHMMTLLFFLLTVAALTMADSGATFKEKAAENVKVEYSQGRSYSEMTVSYNPHDLLEDKEAGEVSLTLETKTGDGCWRRAGSRTRLRKVEVWRVEVFPCQEVHTRLVLDRGQCVDQLITASLAATEEQILESGYRPPNPANPALGSEDGFVYLSFTGTPCVHQYDVYYDPENGDKPGRVTLNSGTTMNGPISTRDVLITGMNLDTNYTITIEAKVGTQFGSLRFPASPRSGAVPESSPPAGEEEECSSAEICPEPELRMGTEEGETDSAVSLHSGLGLLLTAMVWVSLH